MNCNESYNLNSHNTERILVLEAGRAERNYWADLWVYRELFAILAWRDISVRYKQTAIGMAWAVLRPVLTMVVFTVVFGRIAKLPSDGSAPYSLMVFAGIVPWFLFSSILSEASSSLLGNANLITKVYFPRLVMPLAAATVAGVDFLINTTIFIILLFYFGLVPGWQIAFLPLFVLLAVIASIGPALFIAALNVKYRDFRYIIPFIIQLGLYISPVGFSSSIVPAEWRSLYSLNPMVSVIEGFRWCVFGETAEFYLPGLVVSVAMSLVFLWLGIRYFRFTERQFADLI